MSFYRAKSALDMKNFIVFLTALTLMFLGASCSNSTSKNTENDNNEEPTTTEVQHQDEAEAKYDVSFPVYESYDQLAPIFNFKNDSTYIINFWATWCKPCVKELPYFEKLHEEISGEKARIILVSMDFPNQIETRLKEFVIERKLKSDVVVLTDPDQNGWIPKVEEKWDGAIPVTVIYNAENRKFFSGELDNYDMLASTVKELL